MTSAGESPLERARWIGGAPGPLGGRERPCALLRRAFTVERPVRAARLFASALGVYEARLNGERVGDECLAPLWTDYRQRVMFQEYEVTELLAEGENVLGVILGDGWYAGHVASRGPGQYGPEPLFACALELDLEGGERDVIVTDGDWLAATGEHRYADLIMGQVIDHRHARPGWDRLIVPLHHGWAPARVTDAHPRLVPQAGPPARVIEERRPERVIERGPGAYLLDMGQNLAGWMRLKARGPDGQRIVLRHAEALDAGGNLYTANLRTAQATDEYILAGDGEEVFEPRFTHHGFRYVEVTGLPGRLGPDDAIACVVHADMAVTGGFECSHAGLNQLQSNIMWSLRDNFLAVPTDCPQRDERLGWTGDAQVFAATAALNMDVRGFLTRWLQDLVQSQREDGAIPDVVPPVSGIQYGSAGWGDAVVIVPWTLHHAYGDLEIVEACLPAIDRWLTFLTETSDGLVRPATGYGDWLSIEAETPMDLAGTAYFAYSARLAAELAAATGRHADAKRYSALFAAVRQAFRQRFVVDGARVAGETQTGYVLALHVGLLDEAERPLAARHLVDDIRSRDWHLSTGFLGTPWLLPTLAAHGHLDVAHRLLLQETFPSWLYQVRAGATTMWERWDSWTAGRGFHPDAMNSLNHYAYGSVGQFLFESLGGIRRERPGYETVRIAPRPAPGVTWARCWVETPRGRIECAWRRDGDRIDVDHDVPDGVEATLDLP